MNGTMSDIRYGYVYITENLINHKKYIGKHAKSKFDESYKGSGMLIRRALKKYGKENFKTEIIEWCSSLDELNEREIYWISYYNAVSSGEFYNQAFGGDGGDTLSGLSDDERKNLIEKSREATSELWEDDNYRRSVVGGMHDYWSKEESKKLASERAYRMHSNNKELRKNHSERMLGENNPNYGKHRKHTDDTKKQIGLKCSGEKNGMYGKPSPCRRKIMCVERGKVYNSVSEAAKDVNGDVSSICNAAKAFDNGKIYLRYGFHWRYVEREEVAT